MSEPQPTEYRAMDEYLRSEKAKSLPGNMPAKAMRSMMAKMADPHIKEQMIRSEHMGSPIAKEWPRYQKTEKIEYVLKMTSVDDIAELLVLEQDDDICDCLISRRRELRIG